MIPYRRKTLANGLTVLANRDRQSKLAAVNILYKVGARNENPGRTGFAHLFEHLMFRGTRMLVPCCFSSYGFVVKLKIRNGNTL